ncbi:MAG: fimbrillin family protein [Muribaculaceae bacterium]|nr:fimbrillin family protein [Muribaculaceae bacterium]
MNIIYYKRSFYFFLSVLAVCVTSSCSSDCPGNKEGEGVGLSFASPGFTRASVTTDISTVGSRFAVCGDMIKGKPGSGRIVIFNNTEVEYDGANWNYGETRYWFPGYEYSFVAIHPVTILSGEGRDWQYSNSSLSFRYSIPVSDEGRINKGELADIIAATHRRKYSDKGFLSASPVKLNFFHTMSRINFLLKYEGSADKVRITKIELEGVAKTAVLNLVPAPLSAGGIQTDDYTLSWTNVSDKGSLIADINTDVDNGDTQPLCPESNAIFMIPQPENNGIIMKIFYIPDGSNDSEEQTLTAASAIGGWEAGKVYTYSLALNIAYEDVNMSFDVNVAEWKEGASTDISVPRK